VDLVLLKTDTVADADIGGSSPVVVGSLEVTAGYSISVVARITVGNVGTPLQAQPGDKLTVQARVGTIYLPSVTINIVPDTSGMLVTTDELVIGDDETIELLVSSDNAADDAVSVLVEWFSASLISQLNSSLGMTRVFSAREELPHEPEVWQTLALPIAFPVTLQRNSTRYRVAETAANFQLGYTAGTLYVSEVGDDTTGDGSLGNPYRTVTKAHTEALNNYTVILSPGIYPPFTVTKNLFITCPDGFAYIGVFDDWSTAQIDPTAVALWNVDDVIPGRTFSGYLRTDGVLVSGVRGTCRSNGTTLGDAYQVRGVMSAQLGSTSSNFSTGTSETIPQLVTAGSILAWTDLDTTGVVLGGTTRLKNIIIANHCPTGVVNISGGANIVFDTCEFYGGHSDGTFVAETAGATVVLFNCRGSGSPNDILDYRSNVVGVEVDCVFKWPYIGVTDNTSTAHGTADVLRVGGLYAGGSRVMHDIDTVDSFMFSCEVRDALFNDKVLIAMGAGGSATKFTYGDVTLTGEYTSATAFDVNTVITQIELDTPWPF
jgi:hypothetical protein